MTATLRRAGSDERLRVLLAVGTLEVGGAEQQIVEMCRGLREDFEFHVVTLTPGGPLADAVSEAGARLSAIRRSAAPSGKSRLARAARFAMSRRRFHHVIASVKPHVIHAYLFEMSVVAAAARWPRRSPPLLISRRSLVDWIARDPIYFPLAQWSNRQADLVLANSEAVRRHAIEKDGADPQRIRVIYNGVDTELFRPGPPEEALARELKIPPCIPVVGMVANLYGYKGHAEMIEAAARLAGEGFLFTLLFVGRDGNASESVRRQVREQGLAERVLFTGLRSDVPRVLKLFDVFVSASHEEGFSNSVLEAMASGKAVVATSVGGTVEQIEDGMSGLLVKPRDPRGLASTLGRLLRDPALRVRLATAARRRVVERFSLQRLFREMSHLYRQAGSHGGNGGAAADTI